MSFANLGIGKRLGLGFGLLCIMLVCMIGLSSKMLGRINDGTDDIVNDRMPKIEATNALVNKINDIAIALRNMMLSDEPADRARQTEVIMTSRKDIDRLLGELDKSLQLPEARQLLAEMKMHEQR